jgi:hypothetical protein
MRVLRGIGMLAKRAKMALLCDGYNCLLDFDGPGIVDFGHYEMSLADLSMMSKATSAHRQRLRFRL